LVGNPDITPFLAFRIAGDSPGTQGFTTRTLDSSLGDLSQSQDLSAKLKTVKDSTDLFNYGQSRAESDTLHAKRLGASRKDRARKVLSSNQAGKLNSLKERRF
jgi:hypothetical protein